MGVRCCFVEDDEVDSCLFTAINISADLNRCLFHIPSGWFQKSIFIHWQEYRNKV